MAGCHKTPSCGSPKWPAAVCGGCRCLICEGRYCQDNPPMTTATLLMSQSRGGLNGGGQRSCHKRHRTCTLVGGRQQIHCAFCTGCFNHGVVQVWQALHPGTPGWGASFVLPFLCALCLNGLVTPTPFGCFSAHSWVVVWSPHTHFFRPTSKMLQGRKGLLVCSC